MWSKLTLALSALAVLGSVATAHAETFGRTTVGATPSGALRADYKRGSKFTLSEAGTATKLCAWVDGKGSTTQQPQAVRFALYRDVNGAPGAKVAQTDGNAVPSGWPAQWLCQDTAWTPLTAGAYWLMIHTGGPETSGPTRYYYDGAANFVTNADNFQDSSADPAGPVGTGNGTISIYAIYTPATKVQHAGVTTVGSTASAGLRPEFKRGSSITLTQAGQVTALTAYLDGFGSANGDTQGVQLALYEDLNGVPGKLVTQSNPLYIRSSTPARWFTFPTPEGTVHAGKYWVMIHSGDRTGVIRYFYQGTGNWFGNADVFYDGSSSPFGTAGAGNGTISAYVSYAPTVTPKTFGYTKIGSNIEFPNGEPYDFNEGSRFRLVTPGATFDGLYAYLDGKGTGSGSQQVRMTVYGDQSFTFGPNAAGVLITSDIVTIPAGKAPGWVKFNITPTALPPGFYWIAIHTGTAGGIVRRYSDNGGKSQFNGEDHFADGPNSSFVNTDGELQGGYSQLSVYATYTTN